MVSELPLQPVTAWGRAFACIVLATCLVFAGWSLFNASKSIDAEITKISMADSASGQTSISLPFTDLFSPQNSMPAVTVDLTVPADKLVYVPHYLGVIEIYQGGELVLATPDLVAVMFNKPTPLLFDPADFQFAGDTVNPREFQLRLYSVSNIARLSEMYIGTAENFSSELSSHRLKEISRLFLLGTLAVVFALTTALLTMKSYRHIVFPFMVILSSIMAITFADTNLLSNNVALYYHYLIPLFPLLSAAIGTAVNVSLLDSNDINKRMWFASSACSLLIYALWFVSASVSITQINALLSVPLFSLLITFFLFRYIFPKIQELSIEAFLVLSISLAIVLCLFHDVLSYTGLINSAVFLAGTTPVLLIVLMMALFSRFASATTKRLESFNLELTDKLAEQKRHLDLNHRQTAVLQAKNMGLAQRQNLNLELHDGVLTYLAMINAMTEQPTTEREISLYKLARNATREIRIILDSDPVAGHSLFTALASLRIQLVEPLEQIGLRVRWDMTSLYDYVSSDSGTLMDVVRIIQECIHNAVERSDCKALIVRAVKDNKGRDVIAISNLGGKAYRQQSEPGHGIHIMQQRAERIGALFSIQTRPTGARVLLVMPPSIR